MKLSTCLLTAVYYLPCLLGQTMGSTVLKDGEKARPKSGRLIRPPDNETPNHHESKPNVEDFYYSHYAQSQNWHESKEIIPPSQKTPSLVHSSSRLARNKNTDNDGSNSTSGDDKSLKVRGLCDDLPRQSQLQFNACSRKKQSSLAIAQSLQSFYEYKENLSNHNQILIPLHQQVLKEIEQMTTGELGEKSKRKLKVLCFFLKAVMPPKHPRSNPNTPIEQLEREKADMLKALQRLMRQLL